MCHFLFFWSAELFRLVREGEPLQSKVLLHSYISLSVLFPTYSSYSSAAPSNTTIEDEIYYNLSSIQQRGGFIFILIYGHGRVHGGVLVNNKPTKYTFRRMNRYDRWWFLGGRAEQGASRTRSGHELASPWIDFWQLFNDVSLRAPPGGYRSWILVSRSWRHFYCGGSFWQVDYYSTTLEHVQRRRRQLPMFSSDYVMGNMYLLNTYFPGISNRASLPTESLPELELKDALRINRQ